MKYWQCTICKYIHEGDEPPEKCPICGVPADKFVEIDEKDIPEGKKPKTKVVQETPASSEPAQTIPEPEPEPDTLIGKVEALLVKHHAHPVSVHTPNGVLPMAVVLYFMAWMFNADLLAKTAMISQIFVILSLPFVIYTGTVEWRKKYNTAMTTVFKIKIISAALTSAICVITLAWYVIDPVLLDSGKAGVFILMNFLMLACAGIAGHIGGKLVFKD